MASDTVSVLESNDEIIENVPLRVLRSKKAFQKYRPVNKPVFKDDRHSFYETLKFQVPNPYDMIYWSALIIVEESQKDQPFKKFANELFLSALNCAPTIFFSCHETYPVVHALYREKQVVLVQLKLVCDLELGWASGTVLVRDDDRWIPLATFIATRLQLTVETTGQLGYWIQQRWWKSMGRPFRLNDLPVEIRDKVLLFALGEKVVPTLVYNASTHTDDVVMFKGNAKRRTRFSYDYPVPEDTVERVPATNLSVLRLSKKLSKVTTRMLWKDTVKVFFEDRTLRFVCAPPARVEADCLRRMQLTLSPIDFVNIFNVGVLPFSHDEEATNVLADLPSLNSLELEFADDPGHTSAWTAFFGGDSTTWAFFGGDPTAWADAGMNLSRAPCQRVFVDMVMSFAAPSLRNVKRVNLSGLVKTSTKHKWEQLLNTRPFSMNEEMIEEWKKEFGKLECHELPPRCLCPKECGHGLPNFDHDDVADKTERSTDIKIILDGEGW